MQVFLWERRNEKLLLVNDDCVALGENCLVVNEETPRCIVINAVAALGWIGAYS